VYVYLANYIPKQVCLETKQYGCPS